MLLYSENKKDLKIKKIHSLNIKSIIKNFVRSKQQQSYQ